VVIIKLDTFKRIYLNTNAADEYDFMFFLLMWVSIERKQALQSTFMVASPFLA
jgi:hypothetical protein